MGCRGSVLVALALCWFRPAWGAERWLRMHTAYFELITDARERDGAALLAHLEQVRRLFFRYAALHDDPHPQPVRILAFRSPAEYAPYRVNDAADAYYVGGTTRDYIVLPFGGAADFHTAAHEYVHLVARHAGLELPAWLAEGLSEVFATLRFHAGQATIGAANPARLHALLRFRWMPLGEVITAPGPRPERGQRNGMYYAESWALTHMLLLSPAYRAHFAALLEKSAVPTEVYGVSATQLEKDLHLWVAHSTLPSVTLPAEAEIHRAAAAEPVTQTTAELAMAELLLESGRREQARAAYLRLEPVLPANPDVQAALGRIAVENKELEEARRRFRRALELGIRNAPLCYEYAILAADAGVPREEVISALERALELDPGFDDARYSLALAQMNAGRHKSALAHLQALRVVPQRRAYAYFSALADTQLELGMREEAVRSAAEARRYAHSDEELAHAGELAWMAQSEIVVQLSADGSGRLQRVARGSTAAADWNPFVEPGDRMERREGDLREVDCSSEKLLVTLVAGGRPLVLSVPNPGRVQVRESGAGTFEFVCGKQEGPHVRVDYAAAADPATGVDGTLRGIQLLP